jgi:hypothetical protein
MPDTSPDATTATAQPRPADPGYDRSLGAAALRGEVYRPPEYLEYLEKAAAALKTVRMIVYAGMTSFVILAAYGFVLIYQLTRDVHMAVTQTEMMTQQMQAMTRIMANMHESVAGMRGDIGAIQADFVAVNGTVATMSANVARMGEAVTLMQHSARNLDQSVSPMMGTVNRFIPFSGGNSQPYPGPPPYSR